MSDEMQPSGPQPMCLDDLTRELAALREDNARAESRLRAHVAALVKTIRSLAPQTFTSGDCWCSQADGNEGVCHKRPHCVQVQLVVNDPDLATLAAKAQAREAFEKGVRELLCAPKRAWMDVEALVVALDAARGTP